MRSKWVNSRDPKQKQRTLITHLVFIVLEKTIVNKSHSTKIYISRMIKTILKRLPLLISYKNGNNYNILYLISLKSLIREKVIKSF